MSQSPPKSSPPEILAIGKWKHSALTGVQRFAKEVDERIKERFSIIYLEPLYPILGRVLAVGACQLVPLFRRKTAAYGPCNIGVALKKKQLVVIHDTAVYDVPDSYQKKFILYYKFMFWLTIPFAKSIGTVSEFSKKRLEHHFPSAKGKVHVVGNGVSPFWFEDVSGKREKFILLVSSRDPKKNFAALVKAWLDLIEKEPALLKGWSLKIVGAQNSKIFQGDALDADHETIDWLGRVSDEELRRLYATAGGFAFPSKYEGFGLPPLEAMAVGAPVATSNAASLPEVGGPEYHPTDCPEGCVLYFDPESHSAMVDALQRLVALPEADREAMVKNARARAKGFTWEVVGERVEKALLAL